MTEFVCVRDLPLVEGRRIIPEGVVYVGRRVSRVGLPASPWGNPYRPEPIPERSWSREWYARAHLRKYERWLEDQVKRDPWFLDPLRGKRLACWCKREEECHVRYLIEAIEKHPALPRRGERPIFGIHRQPTKRAETALAWPSLAALRGRADARERRAQQREARR